MRSFSGSPNLEQLKKLAKDLLKAFRAGDPPARQRVAAQLPRFAQPAHAPNAAIGSRAFVLADALLVIAREAGFASWPKLKAALTAPAAPAAFAPAPAPDPSAADAPAPGTRIAALAHTLAELAARGDVVELARRFSQLPLRDILAVRAALVERGGYAALVDALIAGLEHADSRVRHDCAHALDHFADERCVEPLRRLLDDPVPRVRRVALHVLSCSPCKLAPLPTGDDLVARVAQHALHDGSINVRRHATIALGSCGSGALASDTLDALLARETDPAIRHYAEWARRRLAVTPT